MPDLTDDMRDKLDAALAFVDGVKAGQKPADDRHTNDDQDAKDTDTTASATAGQNGFHAVLRAFQEFFQVGGIAAAAPVRTATPRAVIVTTAAAPWAAAVVSATLPGATAT